MHVRDLYEASYLKTNYRALIGRHHVDCRIDGFKQRQLWRLNAYQVEKWAFICAENPNSMRLSERENAVRSASLLRYLHKRHLRYFFGLGIPDFTEWPIELGFFVINISLFEAKRIGQKLNQNAIVFSRALRPLELVWLV